MISGIWSLFVATTSKVAAYNAATDTGPGLGEVWVPRCGTVRAWTEEQLVEISQMLLDRLARRLRAQHIQVEFSDVAVKLLAREGFDPQFGARPLRRTIQRLVENELSRLVLSGEIEPGDKARVDADGDDLKFDVEKGAASETAEARAPEATAAR